MLTQLIFINFVMILKHFRFNFTAKKSPVRILHTHGNNIHFNLALEEHLFEV